MFVMSGLLTTNIISQLLSVRCKEPRDALGMKINSMQITAASGFINFIVYMECLTTACSATVVGAAAAFKTRL